MRLCAQTACTPNCYVMGIVGSDDVKAKVSDSTPLDCLGFILACERQKLSTEFRNDYAIRIAPIVEILYFRML